MGHPRNHRRQSLRSFGPASLVPPGIAVALTAHCHRTRNIVLPPMLPIGRILAPILQIRAPIYRAGLTFPSPLVPPVPSVTVQSGPPLKPQTKRRTPTAQSRLRVPAFPQFPPLPRLPPPSPAHCRNSASSRNGRYSPLPGRPARATRQGGLILTPPLSAISRTSHHPAPGAPS